MTLEDLKDLIAAQLDITMFLDLIDLELEDVLDKFDEEIKEHFETLKQAVE